MPGEVNSTLGTAGKASPAGSGLRPEEGLSLSEGAQHWLKLLVKSPVTWQLLGVVVGVRLNSRFHWEYNLLEIFTFRVAF